MILFVGIQSSIHPPFLFVHCGSDLLGFMLHPNLRRRDLQATSLPFAKDLFSNLGYNGTIYYSPKVLSCWTAPCP